jgi:endogenous inhibitor of DNA gyrase (YacG/DUF329 family)
MRYGLRMKAAGVCPTCKGPRAPYPENPAFPFCSGRCKLAELNNWFEGRYSLAGDPLGPDDESERDKLN